jgi:uncharacterized membrane protein YgcG
MTGWRRHARFVRRAPVVLAWSAGRSVAARARRVWALVDWRFMRMLGFALFGAAFLITVLATAKDNRATHLENAHKDTQIERLIEQGETERGAASQERRRMLAVQQATDAKLDAVLAYMWARGYYIPPNLLDDDSSNDDDSNSSSSSSSGGSSNPKGSTPPSSGGSGNGGGSSGGDGGGGSGDGGQRPPHSEHSHSGGAKDKGAGGSDHSEGRSSEHRRT